MTSIKHTVVGVVSSDPTDKHQGVEKFCHMVANALNDQDISARVIDVTEAKLDRDYKLLITSGPTGFGLPRPRIHVYHGCSAVQIPLSYRNTSFRWRTKFFVESTTREFLSGLTASIRVSVAAQCANEIRARYGLHSDVIDNAVDTSVFRWCERGVARAKLGWDIGGKVALFIGRPEARKQPELAIRAAQAIGYKLCLASGTPYEGMDWLGRLDEKELALTIAAADVVFFPTLYEANSLAILEAIAVGTPTVATRVGYVQDILTSVPEFRHLTAEAGDENEFISAARLTTQKLDIAVSAMAKANSFVRENANVATFELEWGTLVRQQLTRMGQ